MLGIDDPIHWMNNTEPKVLDLWIAWLVFSAEDDKQKMIPAEQAFQQLAEKHIKAGNG